MTEFREKLLVTAISRANQIMEAATKAGVAYLGYKATDHWTGALTGLIALRLAEGGNLAGGAIGVGVLGTIGLTNLVKSSLKFPGVKDVPEGSTLTWAPSVEACHNMGGYVYHDYVAPLGECHCVIPNR